MFSTDVRKICLKNSMKIIIESTIFKHAVEMKWLHVKTRKKMYLIFISIRHFIVKYC